MGTQQIKWRIFTVSVPKDLLKQGNQLEKRDEGPLYPMAGSIWLSVSTLQVASGEERSIYAQSDAINRKSLGPAIVLPRVMKVKFPLLSLSGYTKHTNSNLSHSFMCPFHKHLVRTQTKYCALPAIPSRSSDPGEGHSGKLRNYNRLWLEPKAKVRRSHRSTKGTINSTRGFWELFMVRRLVSWG